MIHNIVQVALLTEEVQRLKGNNAPRGDVRYPDNVARGRVVALEALHLFCEQGNLHDVMDHPKISRK
jgi:hypothetical protein